MVHGKDDEMDVVSKETNDFKYESLLNHAGQG